MGLCSRNHHLSRSPYEVDSRSDLSQKPRSLQLEILMYGRKVIQESSTQWQHTGHRAIQCGGPLFGLHFPHNAAGHIRYILSSIVTVTYKLLLPKKKELATRIRRARARASAKVMYFEVDSLNLNSESSVETCSTGLYITPSLQSNNGLIWPRYPSRTYGGILDPESARLCRPIMI